jgi:hypothetical protein
MKTFKAILVSAFTFGCFYASAQTIEVKLSPQSAGAMLGQAAISHNLLPSEQEILSSLLLGPANDFLYGIINVNCTLHLPSNTRSCIFRIGEDDLTDGDSGWGTTYFLEIETEGNSDHMLSVKMNMIAG